MTRNRLAARSWRAALLILLFLTACNAPRESAGSGSTLASATSSESAHMTIDVVALNNLGAQERRGLLVEVDRVVIGRREALADRGLEFLDDQPFRDMSIVGQILFKVANTSDQARAVFPEAGIIEVNGERIELTAFGALSRFGQPISGALAPGYRANGGVWFGIARSRLADIRQMTLTVPLSTGTNAETLRFALDLGVHRYEPVPENRH